MTQEEKLEEAKRLYETANADQKYVLESLFPELKESEDEESKNWILEYLYDGLRKSDEQFKGQFKAAIAWLEKQGEQILANSAKTCKDEQNPAWSEEDELYIRELESLVKQVWATAEHKNDKDTIHKMSDLLFFSKDT